MTTWRAATRTCDGLLAPFHAVGTGALGIAGLAVRSSDQALAAAGALEVATRRLGRSTGTLGSAAGRSRDALNGLIAPATMATGERRRNGGALRDAAASGPAHGEPPGSDPGAGRPRRLARQVAARLVGQVTEAAGSSPGNRRHGA